VRSLSPTAPNRHGTSVQVPAMSVAGQSPADDPGRERASHLIDFSSTATGVEDLQVTPHRRPWLPIAGSLERPS
jgi:hypothetical protein